MVYILHAALRNQSVVKKQCWSKDKVSKRRGVTKLGPCAVRVAAQCY